VSALAPHTGWGEHPIYVAGLAIKCHECCICHSMKGMLYWRQDSRRASALRFRVVSHTPRPDAVQHPTVVVAATGSE